MLVVMQMNVVLPVMKASLHVLMVAAYLEVTTVMVPLKTAMPDGDLTVQTVLMKY
jgi:hypothetical protein